MIDFSEEANWNKYLTEICYSKNCLCELIGGWDDGDVFLIKVDSLKKCLYLKEMLITFAANNVFEGDKKEIGAYITELYEKKECVIVHESINPNDFYVDPAYILDGTVKQMLHSINQYLYIK